MTSDDDQKPAGARDWEYGAEYWVPEAHLFKSGEECLERFPGAGPACGLVSTTAYLEKCEELEAAKRDIERLSGALQDGVYNCSKHEDRIKELEAALKPIVRMFNVYKGARMISDQLAARDRMDNLIEESQEALKGEVMSTKCDYLEKYVERVRLYFEWEDETLKLSIYDKLGCSNDEALVSLSKEGCESLIDGLKKAVEERFK